MPILYIFSNAAAYYRNRAEISVSMQIRESTIPFPISALLFIQIHSEFICHGMRIYCLILFDMNTTIVLDFFRFALESTKIQICIFIANN